MTPGVPVPYTQLVQQFKSSPPGKLYCLHGTGAVFRISLAAAAHVLLGGMPVTLVDGTNRFDAYYLAEFARKHAGVRPDGRTLAPADLLDNIYVSRAFTCYQMEAVVTERLPAFVAERGSPVVIIFGLLDTFYDDQAPLFQVKAGLQRVVAALRRLRTQNVAVLLASLDVTLGAKERNGLFPALMSAMDSVYRVVEEEGGQRILHEQYNGKGALYGTDNTHVHHGHPAGNGKLGKIPARAAPGRPGSA
ncbi:MAG TPA: hypothetical protein VML00_12485 [Bacteroidota bacterium]|nr:hypothetical protein [Bacteroidota bacterium]